MIIATKHDLDVYLADPTTNDAALAYLQAIMDERHNYGPDGGWGIVEPNGLTRLGLTAAEAVAMGALDRVVDEPVCDYTAYQAQAIARVEAERDRRLYSTFTDSQGVAWVVDDRGRKQLSDRLLLTMGGMSPASWEWTTATGGGVTMTPDTLKTLCAELAVWHDAHFVACRVAVGAIVQERTRAGIDAAADSVVWPG